VLLFMRSKRFCTF